MKIENKVRQKLKRYIAKREEFAAQIAQAKRLYQLGKMDLSARDAKLQKLQPKISRCDLQMRKTVVCSPLLTSKVRLLMTVPGVGPILATTLLVELPMFDELSLFKVCVRLRLNDFRRKKYNGKRYKATKRLLYLCASNATYYNEALALVKVDMFEKAIDGIEPLPSNFDRKTLFVFELLRQMHKLVECPESSKNGTSKQTNSNTEEFLYAEWF